MITARSKAGGPRPPSTARTNASNMHDGRFTKLKAVLLNNLLKAYHKKANRQHDEDVYRRAVEEVDKILAGGKLTEKDLQNLQRNFANSMLQNQSAQDPQKQAAAQPHKAALEIPAARQEDAAAVQPPGSSLPSYRSPKKPRKHVDEWSVMTLYSDVAHFEEQKKVKAHELEEKAKTRQMLLDQIEERKRQKEMQKQQEKEAALDQQSKYEQWKKERDRQDELRHQKILSDREAEAQVLHAVQQRKKEAAERALQEEQDMLKDFARQINEERMEKDRQIQRKQEAYQRVLVENEKDLERKRMMKEREREEDARLFRLQIEMAEKQERMRAEREAERQARLKQAERMAGDLGNRAAQLEAQVEARVQQAQAEYVRKERDRDQSKAEKKKKNDRETHQVLQQQIKMHQDHKEQRRQEEKMLAEKFRKEAEAYKMQQQIEKKAKREKALEHMAMLNQQLLAKERADIEEGGMSEVELRLNANILKKVVESEVSADRVPASVKEKVSHSEKLKAEATPCTRASQA